MELNKISVIVPIYNVERYLGRCIESIVNQTYKNLEIILVDDGSPDNCPQMCDDWAKKDERIKVVHKKNGGLSDARNAGMEIATGDYIGFVDSDDWIAPDMYKKLMNAIEKDYSDISACGVEMVFEDGSPVKMLTLETNCVLDREQAEEAIIKETVLKQPVWYKLYKNTVIDGILFEVGKYHEDVFWSYQAVGNARKVSVIDYKGYFYWQRTGSIMGEGYSLKRLDAIRAKIERQKYLEKYFPKLSAEGCINLWLSCVYSGQQALMYLNKSEQKTAFSFLGKVLKENRIENSYIRSEQLSQRVWLKMARASLKWTCLLRNLLKIGI